ncbi:MAG: NAD+ synthase [Bacteroidales bacterium]|jgi:NAD+ synthase (glutamine-hydrolysing)|nr:NAD+ synthase [Bacteroidales bacterium]
MRISLAQLNYHVGNFEKNSELITEAIGKAEEDGSDLIVFSELSLCGYPPLDLLERSDFVDKCYKYLDIIAGRCTKLAAIVGAPAINTNSRGKKLYNAAYLLADGKIKDRVYKGLLPTYDIYDEYRYFEPAGDFKIIELKGKKIALTICEDLWDEQSFENEFSSPRLYRVSPMNELAKFDPDLVINISASPFAYNKIESRKKIFTGKAARHGLPLFMVNQVGANTDLIFDGSSMVVGPGGNPVDIFPSFKEHQASYELADVIRERDGKTQATDRIGMILSALVFGLEDYFRKMNFRSAVIGLSGGIDSAVCLCIATAALGPSNVKAILLPSMHSSKHSVDDAIELSKRLGVEYDIINIEKAYRAIGESLSEMMKDIPEDVTEENIQARVRSLLLMAISNKFGHILLNTSNKSETAVGYSTLYGDMAGSISLLGDVYKTDIYRLAEHINRKEEVIPLNIIKKEPSAELSPGQKDSDSLPTYDILDSILYQYIELQKPIPDIRGRAYDTALVKKVTDMVNQSEFKRYQAPPILRVSSKSFGPGRRMPLVGIY